MAEPPGRVGVGREGGGGGRRGQAARRGRRRGPELAPLLVVAAGEERGAVGGGGVGRVGLGELGLDGAVSFFVFIFFERGVQRERENERERG